MASSSSSLQPLTLKLVNSPRLLGGFSRLTNLSGFLAPLVFCVLMSSACDPITLIAVPTVAVGAAVADERGLKGVGKDAVLRTKINAAWAQVDPALLDYLTLSVQEGRVLITGIVPTQKLKEGALAATRGLEGVVQVLDEIQVGDVEKLGDYTRDGWITTKLKTQLLTNPYVASRNYSIRTVCRVIYLTGTAKSQKELELVLQTAKEISGVRRVVNYVRIKDHPERWTPPYVSQTSQDPGPQVSSAQNSSAQDSSPHPASSNPSSEASLSSQDPS